MVDFPAKKHFIGAGLFEWLAKVTTRISYRFNLNPWMGDGKMV